MREMKIPLRCIALIFLTLLSAAGCRDRDALLMPSGERGALLVSVRFASADSLDPLKMSIAAIKDKKPAGSGILLAQAALITSIHALVFDETSSPRKLLAETDLAIDRTAGTFGGSLEVEAGDSRVVAVQAYEPRGVTYLGVSEKLSVAGGGTTAVDITLASYLPVITAHDEISLTGYISFQWAAVSHADSYIAYAGRSASFTNYDSLVVEGSTSASFEKRPQGLIYMRVRAVGGYAWGAPGDTAVVRVTSPPEAQILSPARGATVSLGAQVLFLARAFDSEEGYLAGGSVSWASSINGNFAAGPFVLYDRLSAGTHLLTMTARNAFGALATDTLTLTVAGGAVNAAPEVTISAPFDSAQFNAGEPVLFLASGQDAEDGRLPDSSFYWISSLDGYFGKGGSLQYSGLRLGAHKIVLVGVDRQGAAGADSLTVNIVSTGGVPAPTARIITPSAGAIFNAGSGILFSAQVSGVSPAEAQAGGVWWSSSLSGKFGTGLQLVAHGLPLGPQTIFLTAVNAFGGAAQDSVAIDIVSSGGNSAPAAVILSPNDLASFPAGASITFLGRALDLEEGVLGGNSLSWISSLGGAFGSGDYFSYSGLPSGDQWIYLLAADASGAAGVDSIRILVGAGAANNPPQASILYPKAGASFAVGTLVLLSGSAADPEEGQLPASGLSWYSSRDGLLGHGDYLLVNNLSQGNHLLRLLATDSQGYSGLAEVAVSIVQGGNNSPSVRIDNPADGSAYPLGMPVNFIGGASDPEDGVLGGPSLTWISSLDGQLGTGSSLNVERLSPGLHRILLQAVDIQGAAAVDSITIIFSSPPVVEITSPADGAQFPIGAPVSFSGSARDPEEGVLPAGSLVWYSSEIEKPIGAGAAFVSNTLGIGQHRITLIAADRLGIKDSAWVTISLFAWVSLPDKPGRVRVVQAQNLAYVTNSGDNSVSIVDLTAFSEINRVQSVGSQPAGLDYSPALNRLYVANSGENTVSVVSGNIVEQRIPVGFVPLGVAVSPDESLVFVSNANSASVSMINTSTSALTGTLVDVGNAPGNLLVPPEMSLLFVSNYGGAEETGNDNVAAVNWQTGAKTVIKVGDKPLGLAATSDGGLVFVANYGSNSVSVLSTASLSELIQVSTGRGPTACAVTPDNSQVYVTNSLDGTLSVLDVQSKTVIETIPIGQPGSAPYDIAIYSNVAGEVYALVTDRDLDRLQVFLVR